MMDARSAAPSFPGTGVDACEVCGAADALGLGTCVACGSGSADALVFVERSTRRADRRGIEAWLVEATGGVVGRDAARDVAEGRRPMVGLPAAAARRVSGALTGRGIPVAVVPGGRAWSRTPVGFVALLGLIVGTGVYAGAAAAPWLAGLSVLFAALLGLAAHRRLAEPVWAPAAGHALALPEAAEREVRATLLRLGDGRARRFLRDLAAVSAALVTPDRGPAGAESRAGVVELLHLACDASVDLEQLDASLVVLERQGTAVGRGERLEDAIGRATESRDAIVRRFEEALASLGRLQAASVEAPRRLSELASELAADARRRREAWEEVRKLVG